jgi:arylsulfatase A-like enzyme
MKLPAALILSALCPLLSAFAQPNIILMMGDDHGWEETGYHGHPHVKTPVLDEMAAQGLRLERFHSAHPSCSPTRASFLTGRHPNRMGTFAPGWSFRPEEITVAHVLSKAGFQCAHFGKWHVGTVKAGSPTNPGAMGFHEWLSHDNFFELNPSLSRNGGPPQVLEGESSEILVREAMQFIDRVKKDAKPFFTVIWFGSPHEPYSGLPQDLALYDHLPAKYAKSKVRLTSNETGAPVTRPQGEVLRERYAEITAMDRAIGTLRKHLASIGLRDDTLLFYCGDNGTSADGSLVRPHRGVKGQMYEGGTLVPGLIEWPARIKAPRTSHVVAHTSDLLPTLCALTGQPLPKRPLDGIDLTPVFDGTMTERPAPIFLWDYNAARFNGIQTPPYIDPKQQEGTTPLAKLSSGKATRDFRNVRHPGTIIDADFLGPRAILDGRHKLVIHDGKKATEAKTELFDLEADPEEKKDLAKQQPEHVQQLQAKLRTWQQSVLKSLTGGDYTNEASQTDSTHKSLRDQKASQIERADPARAFR